MDIVIQDKDSGNRYMLHGAEYQWELLKEKVNKKTGELEFQTDRHYFNNLQYALEYVAERTLIDWKIQVDKDIAKAIKKHLKDLEITKED